MPSTTTSSSTSIVGQTFLRSINALIEGDKWGGVTGTGVNLTYSFPWANSGSAIFSGAYGFGNYSYLNEQNASAHYGLNAIQQVAARSALESWANVANITFSEVAESSSNVGDIRFGWTSATQATTTGQSAWGWGSYPNSYWPSGGDIWISTIASGTLNQSWSAGSYNFLALVHELGHALGLKHSFEDGQVLPTAQESSLYTVMSYTGIPNSLFRHTTANADGSYSFSYSTVNPDSPMLYDVAAMQYLYGANMSYKTGNDVYTFDPNTPFYRTLWDASGVDTISVANFSKACIIDLQQGHFSKITVESDPLPPAYTGGAMPNYDGTNALAIAVGCVIENAICGSGNDTLMGNEANNRLDGGAGKDTVTYANARANFTIAATSGVPGGFTITSVAGGIDLLANVEYAKFSDKTVSFDINGIAGQAYRVYQAAFDRTPDNGGLKYWIGIMDSGKGLDTVASGFINSAEFQSLYGSNPTHQQFVTKLYSNVLHRAPDQGGYDYWTGLLAHNQISKVVALVQFSESPENQAGVIGVIQNGIDLLN